MDGSGTNYAAGATFSIGTANITLYAKWTAIKYTVTFNSNGGTAVSSQTVAYNAKAVKPRDPIKTGYSFGGWYKEKTFVNKFDFANTLITANITLYAKWIVN